MFLLVFCVFLLVFVGVGLVFVVAVEVVGTAGGGSKTAGLPIRNGTFWFWTVVERWWRELVEELSWLGSGDEVVCLVFVL